MSAIAGYVSHLDHLASVQYAELVFSPTIMTMLRGVYMKKALTVLVLSFVAVGMVTCYSSSGPAKLSIQLSPRAPTLAVNSSIQISAETTPLLPKYYGSLQWGIQDYQQPADCTEQVEDPSIAVPMSGCPKGWLEIEFPFVGFTTTSAYYYSPAMPTNCTVIVVGQITNPSSTQKIDYEGTASAAVTVTP